MFGNPHISCHEWFSYTISFTEGGKVHNMRAIFCGNLEFDARQSDVERLFRRYGKVDRVDMKSGILSFS